MSEGGESVANYEMDESRFIGLLTKLIAESKNLQNSPSQGLIPKEDCAAAHVIEALSPYTKENGGVLELEKVTFVEGRGNLIIKYPGTTDAICSFVGSHLDVVPADPTNWARDPFTLQRDGDMLYGRGTTDCLGHVAMITDFLITLATQKPVLKSTIIVVFIANEENSSFKGIGVDQLVREGYLEDLKRGPLFWIDSADSQPCIGTAGMLQWKLKTHGKLFHSGLPHKGINAIEFAMDAVSYIQERFYQDFPRLSQDDEYNFVTQSTMKPTQISCTPGALNQLPPECTVQGDVRLSPFHDVANVRRQVSGYVEEINSNPSVLERPAVRGPHSKYIIPPLVEGGEPLKGKVDLTWVFEGENGIACSISSPGFRAICEATEFVTGEPARPFSIGGSLPLVCELKSQGYDVQISGYGISARYHADNEAVSLQDLKNATKILAKIVSILERS